MELRCMLICCVRRSRIANTQMRCKGTKIFGYMQFFLHICSKNDLWLYPRKF